MLLLLRSGSQGTIPSNDDDEVDLKTVLSKKLGQVLLSELIEASMQHEIIPLDDNNPEDKEPLRTTSTEGVPQFSFVKGTVKRKDIESMEFGTENKEGNLFLLMGVRLRDGRLIVSRVRAVDSDKAHSQTTHFSFKLPFESILERLKPNELTIVVPPVIAKWKLKGA